VLRDDLTPHVVTRIETNDLGEIAVTHVEDIGDVLEANKRQALDFGKGFGRNKDEWRHLARIPMTVYVELIKQKVISEDGATVTDPAAFKRWLNDRDNLFFRTSEGKV
jgi:hypothetical protein